MMADAQSQARAALRELVEGRSRHSDLKCRAGVHIHDRGADADGLGDRRYGCEHGDGVPPDILVEPHAFEAGRLGLARQIEDIARGELAAGSFVFKIDADAAFCVHSRPGCVTFDPLVCYLRSLLAKSRSDVQLCPSQEQVDISYYVPAR